MTKHCVHWHQNVYQIDTHSGASVRGKRYLRNGFGVERGTDSVVVKSLIEFIYDIDFHMVYLVKF